jgi:transposase
VTLAELQAALSAAGGSRIVAAKDLDVTHSWVYALVDKFEREGATFPKTGRRKPVGRSGKVYKPTRKEIRAKCAEFQAGWTNRERIMRRVNKREVLTVPWVQFDDDSRDVEW